MPVYQFQHARLDLQSSNARVNPVRSLHVTIEAMRRVGVALVLVAAAAVATFAGVRLLSDEAGRPDRTATPGAQLSPRPMPPLARPGFRSRPGPGPKLLFRPRSSPIEHGVPYRYDVPHCGLTWLVDFDASFWDLADPSQAKSDPTFFINPDRGAVTVVAPNRAEYRSDMGITVQLRRHHGPKAAHLCA